MTTPRTAPQKTIRIRPQARIERGADGEPGWFAGVKATMPFGTITGWLDRIASRIRRRINRGGLDE